MALPILTASSPAELQTFQYILEKNGIPCEIKQELTQAHAFYSSAQAKLYIDENQYYEAQAILGYYGSNQQDATLNIGVEYSRAELELRGKIRKANDLESIEELESQSNQYGLPLHEAKSIFDEEKAYIINRAKNKFEWNDFLAALFEGRFFKYLNRNKSTKYQIENELISELNQEEDINV